MLLRIQEEIIRNHQEQAPVKVVALADDLGLKVYRTLSFGDDTSGMIRRDGEKGGASGFAIYVNGRHEKTRRRFVIAHEIAHFILHESLIGEGIVEDALLRAGGFTNEMERQANAMAAEILMPWHLISRAQEQGIIRIADLASHFDVSKNAMSVRVLGLSYEKAQEQGHEQMPIAEDSIGMTRSSYAMPA